MSASLIRRGLELLSNDIKDVTKVKKKQQQTPSSATVMELVSTKRQGVTKQVKRLQGRLGPGKSKATVKDKRIKSAVEEFRKKQGKSHLSENLKYFMATGCKATDSDTVILMWSDYGSELVQDDFSRVFMMWEVSARGLESWGPLGRGAFGTGTRRDVFLTTRTLCRLRLNMNSF
ncbi:ribosomal protein S19 binding protein 1 [Neolamprologus brichardi]|uniref:ribosomal protein S19 binding protein 1 n=1 Tax=Neolamprologus brichardi TaxID=32507 RepID=UPI001643E9C4|nr:ribosomal protein S19 binding protein 1 [Neolamprologus brichardi]